jgi:sterol desaturase/sphingolipid hydroxylase (fatty acid hydroxylase superfamily)
MADQMWRDDDYHGSALPVPSQQPAPAEEAGDATTTTTLVLTAIDWMTISYGIRGLAVFVLSYWTAVLVYTAIPLVFPRTAARYRLQPTMSPRQQQRHMTVRAHLMAMGLVLFNQVVVSFLVNLVMYQIYFGVFRRTIPVHWPADWRTVATHFVQYALLFDVMFYVSHRALHTKRLYRSIHSLHHRYKAPIPYCAACVHPVEFVMSYLAPTVLPALFWRFSVAETVAFTALEAVHTVHDHCGYHYPWDPFTWLSEQNAALHDEHHRLLVVNYSGAFTMVLDRLCGTYYNPNHHRTKKAL